MCLLAVQYRTMAAAPVLVAANREEFFDRPATPPSLEPGPPRVLCGHDRRAGGTWLGVNQHGLLVAVTNRLKSQLPREPRSRGTLCRELLTCASADEAIARAESELASGRYAGANYLCLDRHRGAIVLGGDHLAAIDLDPGLHFITNGDPDDPHDSRQNYARGLFAMRFAGTIEQFVAASRDVLSRHAEGMTAPTIVLRGPDRGTVSSTIVALAREPGQSVYLHAAGSPDQTAYDDYSPLLREMLTVLAKPKRSTKKRRAT